MSKLQLKAVAVMLGVLMSQASAWANLLANESFEDAGPSPWWSGSSGDAGAWYWDNNANARSGSDLIAIGFYGTGDGWWGQTLAGVSEGDQFDFSTWMKTESGFSGSVNLMVEFNDALGAHLQTDYSEVVTGEHTDYAQLAMRTSLAPAGTVEAAFHIRAAGGANSAMFDDANVDPVAIPEPATLLLLGGSMAALIRMRKKIVR